MVHDIVNYHHGYYRPIIKNVLVNLAMTTHDRTARHVISLDRPSAWDCCQMSVCLGGVIRSVKLGLELWIHHLLKSKLMPVCRPQRIASLVNPGHVEHCWELNRLGYLQIASPVS